MKLEMPPGEFDSRWATSLNSKQKHLNYVLSINRASTFHKCGKIKESLIATFGRIQIYTIFDSPKCYFVHWLCDEESWRASNYVSQWTVNGGGGGGGFNMFLIWHSYYNRKCVHRIYNLETDGLIISNRITTMNEWIKKKLLMFRFFIIWAKWSEE